MSRYSVGMLSPWDVADGAEYFNNYVAGQIDPPCHYYLLLNWGFLPADDALDEWCLTAVKTIHTFTTAPNGECTDHAASLEEEDGGDRVFRFNSALVHALDRLYPRNEVLSTTAPAAGRRRRHVWRLHFRESATRLPGKLMAFLRLEVANAADFDAIQQGMHPDLDSIARRISEGPLSLRNEWKSLRRVKRIVRSILANIPGTAAGDAARLADPTTGRKVRTALRVRSHERRVAEQTLQLADDAWAAMLDEGALE